jgi:3-hydroxyisobutyrate dehydrogenase-like beta-hydroxyacid dehydrogenase
MNARKPVIGFIGLGAMGSRIAKRLIGAGFTVLVFDRTREKGRPPRLKEQSRRQACECSR